MKGLTINGIHTYDDLNLILISKEIGSPAIKEHKIDIEGADGALDLTDFFGDTNFAEVTHKFTFSMIGRQADFPAAFSSVKNALHGTKGRIILDDDPSFFYVGRCSVSNFTNERNIGQIEIEAVCDPWKYKAAETVVRQDVSGLKTFSLTNGRKRAVPTITTTAEMTIHFGGSSWTVGEGSFVIPELELKKGDNVVTVEGAGTIVFRWQEGGL